VTVLEVWYFLFSILLLIKFITTLFVLLILCVNYLGKSFQLDDASVLLDYILFNQSDTLVWVRMLGGCMDVFN
jgi:hypothetical protein